MTARRLIWWIPAVAWAGVIFALSATPNLRFEQDQTLDFVVRKIGHAGVFGVLALLTWFAIARWTRLQRPWAWAIVLTALYAVSDELHQGFVAGRHPAFTDVAIDTAGAVLLVAATLVVLRRRRTRAVADRP